MKTCQKCYAECQDRDEVCAVCGAVLEAASVEEPYLGRVIAGNFLLKKRLGSGAMGTIFLAEQISLGKIVCIKLLHEHLLGDPSLAKRFEREARAASRLKHPNCIQVIDFGQTRDGLLFMAMEYVDGQDLGELLHREFPLDYSRIIHIMAQTANALDEAHAMGVIHRDLKPENIMVEDRRHETDFVKVLDFGIAKITDPSANEADAFQTMAGVVCGTPEYMAPEQARGEKLDPRSDLYALGIILYQLLTNHLPFTGDSAVEIVTRHLKDPPRPPRQIRPEIPKALEELTLDLLAKEREKRPPSALTVRDDLENIARQIAAEEARAMEGGDRTIQGLSYGDLSQAYGDADRTLISLPPEFVERLRNEGDKAAARAAAPATEPSQPAIAAPPPKPKPKPKPPAPQPPAGQMATSRNLPPRGQDADETVRVATSPSVRGESIDTDDDLALPKSSRWPLVALIAVALAVLSYIGYLLFLTGTSPSKPAGGSTPSAPSEESTPADTSSLRSPSRLGIAHSAGREYTDRSSVDAGLGA